MLIFKTSNAEDKLLRNCYKLVNQLDTEPISWGVDGGTADSKLWFQSQKNTPGGGDRCPDAAAAAGSPVPPGPRADGFLAELQCPICLETFRRATTLGCGHTFCAGCLQATQAHSDNTCPLCRRPIKSTVPSVTIENIVRSVSAEFWELWNMLHAKVVYYTRGHALRTWCSSGHNSPACLWRMRIGALDRRIYKYRGDNYLDCPGNFVLSRRPSHVWPWSSQSTQNSYSVDRMYCIITSKRNF